jgi:hypothetical protein
MAKQQVDIGVEGNDGTGDSIRESFKKVNENFNELYAVFGLGGQISFTTLNDTPNSTVGNEGKVLLVNQAGTGVDFFELVSDAGNADPNDEDNTVAFSVEGNQLKVKVINVNLETDPKPTISNPLKMGAAVAYSATTNPKIMSDLERGTLLTNWNDVHDPDVADENIIPSIGLTNRKYIEKNKPGMGPRVADEPANASDYTKTIASYSAGGANIVSHGFTEAVTGSAWLYDSTGTDATGLTSAATYYIRRNTANQVTLHPTAQDALDNTNQIIASGGTGTQTLKDPTYDDSVGGLDGFWTGDAILPRKSITRREGDTMTGALTLHDHPQPFAGAGTPAGADDLQAATKYYVDAQQYSRSENIYVNINGDDLQTETPPGLAGRSEKYAYRTIAGACLRAERLQEAADIDIGPYVQTLTYTDGTGKNNGKITNYSSNGYTAPAVAATTTVTAIDTNRQAIIDQTIAFIATTYPTFVYSEAVCRRDLGLILDSIGKDILASSLTVKHNYLSRYAGLRYFSNASGEVAISQAGGGQYTETVAAIGFAKTTALGFIATALGGGFATDQWYLATTARFDDVLNTIDSSSADPTLVEASNNYKVYISSGNNKFLTQAGDPTEDEPNIDIFPGKIIRGKKSGAVGIVQEYSRGVDTVGAPIYDTIEVKLLLPFDFIEQEEIEYGSFVKKQQISIRIESGTYEEQLPIRLPANVSIKGDEFRRCLVRPAPGMSLSSAANTFFYRDATIDGNITATGGEAYVNDLTGDTDGYYGRHYLTNPAADINISNFGATNPGKFNEAADLISLNRQFIIDRTISFIAANTPPSYVQADAERDVGEIVDSIEADLRTGGRVQCGISQKTALANTVVATAAKTEAAFNNIATIITSVLAQTAYAGAGGVTGQVVNANLTAEANANTNASALVSFISFAFDAGYNSAKDNNEMDIFLCNDNTIIRNITAQRQGGFMMVLDPEGAIFTRSPYVQTGSSFSRSINAKTFAGGIFIDGYCYNMPATVIQGGNSDPFRIQIEAPTTSILGQRKPNLPCSFFEFGRRYQVNAIVDYVANNGSGKATATLVLDSAANGGAGLDDDIDSAGGPIDIVLQGAGNKSMLANDFTQVNDLGYGVVVTNNGLSELVSVFTYYAHTGYLSLNGAQIRSLTGNNSYGNYGLVAQGSDPDEVAKSISLAQDLAQPVKIFSVDQEIEITGNSATPARNAVIRQYDTVTGNVAKATVIFNDDNATNSILSVNRHITATTRYDYAVNDTDPVAIDSVVNANATNSGTAYVIGTIGTTDWTTIGAASNTVGLAFTATGTGSGSGTAYVSLGAPVSITNRDFGAVKGVQRAFIYDTTNYPLNASQLEIHHADSEGTFQPYEVINVSDSGITIPSDYVDGTLTDDIGSVGLIGSKVWRLEFTSGTGGGVATETTGLQFNVAHATNAVLTSQQNVFVNGVSSNVVTRPSTALIFNEQETVTYRTLAFENTITGGIPVVGAQTRITIDDNFDYVDLVVNNTFAAQAPATYSLSGGTTLGDTQGDTHIAVSTVLSANDQARLNSSDVDMMFAWQGKAHVITNYQVVTDSGTGTQFGIISFTDKYNISDTYAGAGLAARASSAAGNNITLQAGLQSAETGNITVNISTCRATSHDFLDIGTGGYNSSNYPDRIFGGPKIAPVTDEESLDSEGFASKAQVQERSRGRCFFASTDQDGFFRVGRFFTVDQGTGRITFNAALVLTNIDGIGFKRGVRVNEFSADSTFTNATADAVPVETAVEGYIDRRLGMDRNGTVLAGAEIIPQTTGGFLALSGAVPMAGDLRMGGQQINDLATPTSGSDAATKAYVDAGDAAYDTLAELEDTDITSPVDASFLVYDLSATNWIDAVFDTDVANSDFSITLDGTTGLLEGQINAGAIVNADINASAAIAQSKLSLSDATAAATAGAAVKGIASFNNADFGTASGYVSIKALGVSNAQLAGSITNAKLSNSSITFGDASSTVAVALGKAVTIQGTANEVSVGIADSTPAAGSPTYTISLPNKIAVDVNGDVYNGTTLILDVSTGELTGNADSADQVKTQSRNTNATHYLTFVTDNNGSATNETIYTDGGIAYNPSTNKLTTDGAIEADGNITLLAGHTVTAPGGYRGAGNGGGTDNGSTIGTSTDRFNTIYGQTFNGTATEALYADLAENYVGDSAYEPGTVLVFGGEAEVTTTNTKSDHRIAGVVTTNPAHLMNSALEGDTVVGVALQGRVPCKVLGKVEKGDMLVTAAKEGYAIVNNTPGVGQVLGKAVGTKEDDGYGIVEVVVGRV